MSAAASTRCESASIPASELVSLFPLTYILPTLPSPALSGPPFCPHSLPRCAQLYLVQERRRAVVRVCATCGTGLTFCRLRKARSLYFDAHTRVIASHSTSTAGRGSNGSAARAAPRSAFSAAVGASARTRGWSPLTAARTAASRCAPADNRTAIVIVRGAVERVRHNGAPLASERARGQHGPAVASHSARACTLRSGGLYPAGPNPNPNRVRSGQVRSGRFGAQLLHAAPTACLRRPIRPTALADRTRRRTLAHDAGCSSTRAAPSRSPRWRRRSRQRRAPPQTRRRAVRTKRVA